MTNFDEEFSELWKKYPNKQGKTHAYVAYTKARRKGVTYEQVEKGLEKYLNYCLKEKSWYRPKHGGTWFHQECWNDEIDEIDNVEISNKDEFGNIIL